MLALLTHWGLRLYRQGTCAPLWHTLASIDNVFWLNGLAALVVAACFTYSVKKLFFQLGPDDDPETSRKVARVAPWLTAVPFFVVPALVDHVVGLSPFFLSLVPSSAALALVASLNSLDEPPELDPDDEECDTPVFRRPLEGLRLFLAGACAAVGAWEGTVGVVTAPLLLALLFVPCICRDRSVSRLMFVWLVGLAVGFAGEGCLLGWPWAAFRPFSPPVVGMAVVLFLSAILILLVRVIGESPWLIRAWCLVLVGLTTYAVMCGSYGREGACERFAKRVLSELGGRTLVIGDGLTDDFFSVLKPDGVRFVNIRSPQDREFLLTFFDAEETVTNRALVVSRYHGLDEMEAAADELGVRRVKPTADGTSSAPGGDELRRAQAESAHAAVGGLRELMNEGEKISAAERRKKAAVVQTNIRRAWASGLRGEGLTVGILTLDVWLGDRGAAESDALAALCIDRADPAANAMLGSLRLEDGKLDVAERYLRAGAKGGGVGAYNDLAVLLVRTGRAEEAETWARKAVAKAPKDWNVRETLVQALTARGQAGEALKELDEAERLARESGQLDRAKGVFAQDRRQLAE